MMNLLADRDPLLNNVESYQFGGTDAMTGDYQFVQAGVVALVK